MTQRGRFPSVLVGLLHVGEPSVPRVREYIRAQVDVDVELLEVAHLPERQAHERLFRAFDGADSTYDALVKVDADMELVEPRLLQAIGLLMRRNPDLDHLVLGVDDWFTGRRIIGMNAWRRGVRWTSPPPELFTDLPTNTARTKLKVLDAGRPLVLHASDPSDSQAVRYGLHRGLKAVATGKASRIKRLAEVVDHAEAMPARGRRLAVAAIGLALSDTESGTALLAATRDADADLDALRERVDDPRLCSDVHALIGRLAVGATTESDERRPDRGTRRTLSAVARSRARIARVLRRTVGRNGPDRRAAQEAWREDLLTLLDDPQASRSSA